MSSPPGPPGPYGGQQGHQRWRDQLGVLALGHLSVTEAAAVRAHVDGCASCRAELAEIAPLAALLDTLDPDRFAATPAPAPDLGAKIREAVARERAEQAEHERRTGADELARHRATSRRRRTTRLGLLASAAALVVVAILGGLLLGRATDRDQPDQDAAPRPYEAISLRDVGGAELVVDRAGVVPHTWGVELEFEAAGFEAGETYRAAFRTAGPGADRLVPAGQFRGNGSAELTCHLQSSAMREDVDRVVVTDASGRRVLVADL